MNYFFLDQVVSNVADDKFKSICWNENMVIFVQIYVVWLYYIAQSYWLWIIIGLDNGLALGTKPLFKPMMTQLSYTHTHQRVDAVITATYSKILLIKMYLYIHSHQRLKS